MKAVVFTAVAATVFGATSSFAQAPQESPPDPTITQNEATTPNAQQSNDQRKARMPMRRELPIVPDPSASSEGAGAGTSGSDTNMKADTPKTGEGAKGAPGDQPAGAETSDRTPEKTTPTPETQVDKTKEGGTSTRTPEKK
jgi:hypothetical protein